MSARLYSETCSKDHLYIKTPDYKDSNLHVPTGTLFMLLNLHLNTTCVTGPHCVGHCYGLYMQVLLYLIFAKGGATSGIKIEQQSI